MPAPLVAGAVIAGEAVEIAEVAAAARLARPALAALTRLLTQLRPAAVALGEMLARSAGSFKELVAKAFTVEGAMAGINKAMSFVTVADAAGKLAVALAGVKGKFAEAATGFGLFGKSKTEEKAAAAAPAAQQVAAAAGGCGDAGGASGIEEVGKKAEEAAPKVGYLQEQIARLKGELTWDKVLETASSYDQLKLSLEGLLGSTGNAAQAFRMIQDFAARTPVSVEDAKTAFEQLWKAGIKPTSENLTAFGNVAGAFNKDITAVTSAVAGVDLGNLDGLKELGLKVEEQGNKLKISFQGVTTTVGNSSREVAGYLEQLGQTRFADGMERQASTFATGFDSVKEAFAGLRNAIGEKGLLPSLESMDVSFAKIINRAQPIADAIGKGLGTAMKIAADAVKVLADHAEIVIPLVTGIAVAASTPSLGEFAGMLSSAKTAVVALGEAILANPIGLIAGAIAAVVAALIIFKDESITVGGTTATLGEWMQATWEVTKDRLVALWEKLKAAWASVRDFLVEAWDVIKDGVAAGIQKIQAFLAGFVANAAEILGGLGRILGAVFGALVDGIKTGINLMIGAITAVPEAVGAAVAAIEQGDFAGVFRRIKEATSDNFGKDYVGDLLGGVADRIGSFATTVADVVRFTAQGVKDDVVKFGRDVVDAAKKIHDSAGSGGGGLLDPRGGGRGRGTGTGGGVPIDTQSAIDAANRNVAAVRAAYDELAKAPLDQMAQKYQTFKATAAQATEEVERQKKALEALGTQQPGVAAAIDALKKAQEAIAGDEKAADQLNAIVDGFAAISGAASTASEKLDALDAASLSEVLQKTEDVDGAMAALDKAITDQQARLAGLNKETDQYRSLQDELQKLLTVRTGLETRQAEVITKVSQGTRDALKALKDYAGAQSSALKVEKLTAYLAAVDKIKTEIASLKDLLGKLESGSGAAEAVKARLGELEGQLGEVQKQAEAEGIKPRTDGFDDSIGDMAKTWDKFVNEAVNSFGDLFLNVLEGNVHNFGDFIDSIKKMFRKMIAEMAADSLKKVLKIPVTFGGEGGTIGSGGQAGKYVGLDAFKDPATGKYDWGRLFGTAAMGLGVGSLVGSFLGKEDNYAELGSQILGVVGAIVGAYFGSPQVGAWIGSIVGGLIGSLIKKGLPSTSATLSVSDGRAQVDAFFSRNKGSLDQIRQYAEGVVKGINDLAKLTDATLLDLPDIKISVKNNKFYRVIDQSGFVKSFGEDYEAAVNYAILLALKGASFSGLSPEVEAALRNTKATTVEELASDIEFAKEVRDIDLEPVTKDLRDVMRRFNEMRERARDLGISLDKLDSAFTKAVNEIKDNILSGLKPFQEAGLTDVEREAKRITEAFAEMRENARLFNEELAREQEARNQQISDMQQQLADKQTLLERLEQMPQIPQEVLDSLADMGIKLPQGLMGNMAETLKEEIKKLIDEIARLQGLNADQTPIDMSEIDRAEQEARRALRERVRDSLDPYLRANLTPVQQQLLQLNDTFEKLRRDAHAAGVSMSEVDKAYDEAIKALRKQVMDQLQPYLDMADGLTPLQVALRDLDKRFDEMRTNAAALGIDMETVNRAEQAAREQLRQQFEDDLKAFGGENPFVAQLDDLKKKFEELTKNAIALGLGTDRVDAAYQQALANLQKQFQDGIQSYLDYGRGMSDIAVRFRDLNRFFDEQREAARALDEAMGFTSGGPNEQLLDEAQAAAFKQLVDEFKASLQDLRDAGLTPTEIAVREMHDRFTQLREDAELLGLSVDELSRLEQQAIERLRGELDAQLDRYLLSDEEQQQRSLQDEFMGYLRDAFALYTYEPGTQEEPEPFPGARALEETFGDVKTASQELAQAFRDLRMVVDPNATPPPPPTLPPPGGTEGPTPAEMVADVLDFLRPLYEGRGMDDVPAEQRQAIDAASTQVALMLEQLRLGMTDDTTALQGALGNLVTLLQQSGIEIDGSLLDLTNALASGDITGFLDELRDGVLGTTDGFGALIDILLSGGDLSLPDLMHQLASGTFDAIQAMLGLTEIPPELAATLKRIGLAYEAAQNQQRVTRQVERGGGDDANREAEQRQRDLDALLRQLEQFEDLQLSPAERELKKLNEQFDEMRENAARLGVSLDRVESAYQLAIADFWERLLGPLNDFLESLDLSELSTLTPQQRLEEAQARFQDLATRAMGGDLEAVQQLQAAAQQYLQEAQSFYASGQGYQDIFALVNSIIQQVIGSLAPGLLPPPSASDFTAMLADTGWAWRDALTTAGIPFGAAAGDVYDAEPGETPYWLGTTPEGAPALSTDLSGMRETNRALLEEVRISRQQEHVDAVELQRRVDEQSEELREVRALLRRLTSTTQYGGRAQ
jgi:hypothetical protein